MLTIRGVASRFRQATPSNVEEALIHCRVPFEFIESGAYRHAFRVPGLPLVAKFCHIESQMPDESAESALNDSVDHSAVEARTVNKMKRNKKRYAAILPHLPKIYYANVETGTVLMHQYKTAPETKRIDDRIEEIVTKLQHVYDTDDNFDLNYTNVGIDEDGTIVILDLGMFEGWD